MDAESDCGQHQMVAIVFVGSVFSPAYARARRRAALAPAARHLAINLALYGKGPRRWLMHEAPAPAPSATRFRLAGNLVEQRSGDLRLTFHDRSCPWRRPIVGEVVLTPAGAPTAGRQQLHPERPHWWWPAAPVARVAVRFTAPALSWRGRAYADANWGDEPLAKAFSSWHWQRLWHPEGTLVGFGGRLADGRLFRSDGLWRPGSPCAAPATAAAPMPLPRSRWGLRRAAIGRPVAHRSLEDTPFYSRSHVTLDHNGVPLSGMHEALDLRRFERRWVQFLLPFRARRSR